MRWQKLIIQMQTLAVLEAGSTPGQTPGIKGKTELHFMIYNKFDGKLRNKLIFTLVEAAVTSQFFSF